MADEKDKKLYQDVLKLIKIKDEFKQDISNVATLDDFEKIRVKYLGKNSELKKILKSIS